MTSPASFTVAQHFAKTEPSIAATYGRLLKAARRLGSVMEDPKKTSIHLVRHTAFAGVAARRRALILTLKSAVDIPNPRITKHEQASPNRWHLEIRLENPGEVDREVVAWLKAAYDLAK